MILPALLAIAGGWISIHWYLGNTLAEFTPAIEDGGMDTARLAVKWAPGDPLTHWRIADYDEKVFSRDNLNEAVREYQMAVALSPYDFRYWLELGHAFEAAGDGESGEKALRRAVELAPSYSYPLWVFGNVLVRQGKMDEAFKYLARAAQADPELQPKVFNLAWQTFDGDVDAIARIACPSIAVRMHFATYLVNLGRWDDAMRIWSTIDVHDRRSPLSEEFKQVLLGAKVFRLALEVTRDIDHDTVDVPVEEHFTNPGFETDLALSRGKSFNWTILSGSQVLIGRDTGIAHSGKASLRLSFKAAKPLDTINVSQIIAVEPNTQYRFECYAKTELLSSATTPEVAIFNARDNTVLTNTVALPTGSNDWEKITFDFTTKPDSDGIKFGIVRSTCTIGTVCPIFGNVWYDDFNLQRIGRH
jgi:tetratricopeptide (TPR) repeat protein